jgi:predicted phage-related endonuclease
MNKLENLVKEFKENQNMIDMLKNSNDQLKNEIIALMENNDTIYIGVYKVTNKLVNSSRFNSKAFRLDHNDLYNEYVVSSKVNRFIVK